MRLQRQLEMMESKLKDLEETGRSTNHVAEEEVDEESGMSPPLLSLWLYWLLLIPRQ